MIGYLILIQLFYYLDIRIYFYFIVYELLLILCYPRLEQYFYFWISFDMVNQVTQSEGFKDENKIKQIPNTDP